MILVVSENMTTTAEAGTKEIMPDFFKNYAADYVYQNN